MLIKQVKKLSPIKRLLYWISEREKIRIAKEANKPKPWTDDEILSSYRFCNVRRMDDRVSQWLFHNWYTPYKDHHNIVLAVVMARLFNNPQTLEHAGFPKVWRPKALFNMLAFYRQENKLFNAAYIVSTNGIEMDKLEYIINKVLWPLAGYKCHFHNSMEQEWKALHMFNGIGSFIGGQIVADLRWAVTGQWSDKHTWAPMGPGSKRGMNRLLGRDIKTPIKQDYFCELLQDVYDRVKDDLPQIGKRLELIDIQSCLCEYDKMERTLFEGRRPKQLYDGKGEA